MNMRILFVGNRRFVLEEILYRSLPLVGIAVIAGSHLESDFQSGILFDRQAQKLFKNIKNKRELLYFIQKNDFDILISNGCPYILPIDSLPKATYVNIHPSYLPDLRGCDPVIGAILYERDAGATCHIMDSGVDTGDIISQVHIPFTDDLDVTTLYQLSFFAEKDAFNKAVDLEFKPQKKQNNNDFFINYKRSESDMNISFKETNSEIIRKIKSFNNKSIGCGFYIENSLYKVFQAEIMHNSYLNDVVMRFNEGEIALSYEDSIVFHKDNQVIRFRNVLSLEGKMANVGDKLF